MAKNLLIITQKLDETDDLLGFFVSWVREFASHYEQVTVIAMAKGEYVVPANVRVLSLGKEVHASKLRQGLRFLRFLWREVRHHDAVFAHMSPVFAIVAWPFTKIGGKRLVLWYLHRSRTLKLRLALVLVDALVTADAGSLTVKNHKIISVGHGIDVARFAVPERKPPEGRPLRILSVGRLSPIKGFETLIRAVARLRDDNVTCEVCIIGRAVMAGDHDYEASLHSLVARLGVGELVHFFGFVPYRDIVPHYQWADIVVGCTPPGGIDKVLLEGMAASCTVATSNTVMRRYFNPQDANRCIFRHGDWMDLADKLEYLYSSDVAVIGARVREAVTRDHNLPVTITNIIAHL